MLNSGLLQCATKKYDNQTGCERRSLCGCGSLDGERWTTPDLRARTRARATRPCAKTPNYAVTDRPSSALHVPTHCVIPCRSIVKSRVGNIRDISGYIRSIKSSYRHHPPSSFDSWTPLHIDPTLRRLRVRINAYVSSPTRPDDCSSSIFTTR